MVFSLGHALANIIIIELEDVSSNLLLLMVQLSSIVTLLMKRYW